MTREKLEQVGKELRAMPGTAIVYQLLVKEKKHLIEVTSGLEDPKKVEYKTLLRKVETNPFQVYVVNSAIEGVKEGDILYISHRYYPYPMIHYGSIYFRIQTADIVSIVSVPQKEADERIQLNHGYGRDWTDEHVELTRKDVLT